METLEKKVAIITGASRGLGLAIAQLYAREGAKVVLSARSVADIEQNATSIRKEGFDATAYSCDVVELHQVEDLARYAIRTYGGFDIWVNNAGVAGPYGATLNLTPDQFQSVLNTNIFGTYYGSITAMRHFLPRRSGKLINVLGAGAKRPAPNQNAYGSTKAWIRVFTLALASEYKDSGVGIFAFQPGLMETDLLTEIVTFKEHEKRLRDFMPFLIRAGGKIPDVPAQKALWLASSATNGKTGLDVRVGSNISFMIGFLREGLRKLLHLPTRKIDVEIDLIPSAFKPLE
jgi:NAD(P)-dependent dehydrogenase (short-subunit alcohol dehydrogenase family)